MKNVKYKSFFLLVSRSVFLIVDIFLLIYLSFYYHNYYLIIPIIIIIIYIFALLFIVRETKISIMIIDVVLVIFPLIYAFLSGSAKLSFEYCSQRKAIELTEDSSSELDRNTCFYNLAMRERNPKYCKYLNKSEEFRCYSDFAYTYKINNICSLVAKSEMDKEECDIMIWGSGGQVLQYNITI